jgi:peptidoglycan/xylan/chitin deacetylase (PgdA/CDA1 family)
MATWIAAGAFAVSALMGNVAPLPWLLGIGGGALGFIAAGVALQGSGVFARPLLAVRTARPELALTFDDGPDPRFTPAILELLQAHGQRATFFVIGERAQAHPELLEAIVRGGHALGNHSWRHAYTTNLVAPRRLAEALREANALLERVSGHPTRWFRAPVGLLSPRLAAAARLAKLQLVGWTASARDGVASRTVEDAVRRLEGSLRPGAILTLHDGALGAREDLIAPAVLAQILARMAAKGLRSVTLDSLLSPTSPGSDAPKAS